MKASATSKNLWSQLYPQVGTRITLPFLFLILVVAAIGILIVTRLVAGNIQERLANQLIDSAQAATNTIVDIERSQLSTLRAMAFTEGVAAALETGNVADLTRLLSSIAINESADDVIMFSSDGEPLLWIIGGTPAEPSNLGDIRQWSSVESVITQRSDALGDKFVDIRAPNDQTTFYFASPVINDQNVLVGGILVGITAENFVRQVNAQALSAVTLFDQQGQVLGTSFRSNALPQLQLDPATAEKFFVDVRQGSPITFEQIVEGNSYQFLYSPFQIRSSQIGTIAVALSVDFVQDRIGTSRNLFFVLFLVMLLFVALLGLLISRTIIQPVFRMLETTRAIQSGDLLRRVNLKTPDELGELGQSFDRMTGQLLQQNREIQQLYIDQVEETARRDAVFSSIRDGVLVLNRRYKVILHNDTAKNLIRQIRHKPDYQAHYDRLLKQPQYYLQPQMLTFEKQHFSVLATPVQLDSGDALGYVLVFRDITALIEAEQLKEEIILQLSHELRTPLTAARGYTDLLRMMAKTKLNTQELGFIENVLERLGVLGELVDQVIEVNTMLADRVKIDVAAFNLNEALHEVIQKARPNIDHAQLDLSVSIPAKPIVIEGDKTRLTQVFKHILKNAYSYTLPKGLVEVKLEETDKDSVSIYVSDTGVGIGPDELESVFDKMYRGRAADAGPTDTRGLGLGLYISKQLITAHHGTILIESEENMGTVVHINLPKSQKT